MPTKPFWAPPLRICTTVVGHACQNQQRGVQCTTHAAMLNASRAPDRAELGLLFLRLWAGEIRNDSGRPNRNMLLLYMITYAHKRIIITCIHIYIHPPGKISSSFRFLLSHFLALSFASLLVVAARLFVPLRSSSFAACRARFSSLALSLSSRCPASVLPPL